LYGGFGLAAGLVCGVLDQAWRRLPTATAAGPASVQGAAAAAEERQTFQTSRFGA
jgi:hypothetical protein